MSGASLGIPGVLYVGTSGEQELAVLHVGPGVGWVALKGLHTWSREISVAVKGDVGEDVCRDLGVVLPERHPEMARLAHAQRAAQAANLVAVESPVVDPLVAKGVRVHTIGSDRITGGFYYFAKGGAGEPVRVQGNLVEMVASTLAASADNAAVEMALDGVIARVLAELSGGALSEAQIELAATLPALGEPDSEAAVKLQTLEGFLVLTMTRASKYEERARSVVEALEQATRRGDRGVNVPLFGDARRVAQPALEVEYAEGESGARQRLTLRERNRWFVAGLMTETVPPPAVAPVVADEKAVAEKAAAAKAVADKAAADKAAAEKAAAEKAAAAKAVADKAAAEKAAAEKAAVEAAAKKAAAEKAAADKAAAEKAAAEKAAADKAATEKAAAEKVAAEKAAAARAAAEKAAAEATAREKAETDRLAAEKLAAETAIALEKAAKKKAEAQATAQKAAAEKKAADRAAAEKAAAKKKRASAAGERAKEQATARTKSDEKSVVPAAQADSKPKPIWLWVALLLAAVGGAYYFAFVRHHG
ncbi:MAG TPA: hypothetical protein VGL81_04050 [Polyangiaceae bacterium]|jgi:hypothetical protein